MRRGPRALFRGPADRIGTEGLRALSKACVGKPRLLITESRVPVWGGTLLERVENVGKSSAALPWYEILAAKFVAVISEACFDDFSCVLVTIDCFDGDVMWLPILHLVGVEVVLQTFGEYAW